MKERILLALARTPLYLLMRLAEGTHALCRFLWERLEPAGFDPTTATVDDYQRHYRCNRRQAYKLYQQYRGTPADTLEIYADGKPLSPVTLSRPNPFRTRKIGNAA
jgi:hypothetical protein